MAILDHEFQDDKKEYKPNYEGSGSLCQLSAVGDLGWQFLGYELLPVSNPILQLYYWKAT